MVEDFVKYFEYYLSAHAPKQNPSPGLADTIAQAKDELGQARLCLADLVLRAPDGVGRRICLLDQTLDSVGAAVELVVVVIDLVNDLVLLPLGVNQDLPKLLRLEVDRKGDAALELSDLIGGEDRHRGAL